MSTEFTSPMCSDDVRSGAIDWEFEPNDLGLSTLPGTSNQHEDQKVEDGAMEHRRKPPCAIRLMIPEWPKPGEEDAP